MSLINQMLQDIEQRESGPRSKPVQAMGPQHDAAGTAWVPQATRWGLSGFMAITALGALTGGGAVWWWTTQPAVAVKATMATAPAPVVNPSVPPMSVVSLPPAATASLPQLPASASGPAQANVQTQTQKATKPQAQPPALHAAVSAGVDKPSTAQPGRAANANVTTGATASASTVRAAVPTPTRAEALYQQALAEIKQSQSELALKSMREALEIQPSHVQARLVMTRLLIERKQPDAAADLLSDGLMLLPQQSRFALALAPLWFAANRQDEAMGLLAQSAISADASPDYHVYYASQLLRLKRFADAGKHYSIALRSNPAMGDWLIGLGLSLQGTSNEKEAMDVFKRAIDTGTLTGQKRELVEQMITGLKSRVGS